VRFIVHIKSFRKKSGLIDARKSATGIRVVSPPMKRQFMNLYVARQKY
jgi:hypothetical protein